MTDIAPTSWAASLLLVVGVALLLHRRSARLSQRRIAELEREREEQMRRFEAANAEIESFSRSVSHDLRAPLRVVDGFAGILLEDYGTRLDEIGREHLQRIRAASSRMNSMIDALLGLSRTTAQELRLTEFDLSHAARELCDELKMADGARAAEVRIEPELRACGDPTLLRLVLQNLLGNAFKFSGQTPKPVIELGRSGVANGHAFFVRDNGAGFDMRFAPRLFGAFQRFHSQSEFPGTGLGLATVERIVRKHGGRIWADSAPGKGACFYFTLPSQHKTGPKQHGSAPESQGSS